MVDYRIDWLRDRISKALGVYHQDVLDTLINDHHEQFQAFMDDDVKNINELEKCVFFIYRTFYDRLVEREVVNIEKGKAYLFAFEHSLFISHNQFLNKFDPQSFILSLPMF